MTLGMLVLLQAVLGFDNLLYISLESKHAPEERQSAVRKWGIGIAVGLRIVLLFLLISMIDAFQSTWFTLPWEGVIEGTFNLHSLIVLVGGVFILYTAMKEIFHMIVVEDFQSTAKRRRLVCSGPDCVHERGVFVRLDLECDRVGGRHKEGFLAHGTGDFSGWRADDLAGRQRVRFPAAQPDV